MGYCTSPTSTSVRARCAHDCTGWRCGPPERCATVCRYSNPTILGYQEVRVQSVEVAVDESCAGEFATTSTGRRRDGVAGRAASDGGATTRTPSTSSRPTPVRYNNHLYDTHLIELVVTPIEQVLLAAVVDRLGRVVARSRPNRRQLRLHLLQPVDGRQVGRLLGQVLSTENVP